MSHRVTEETISAYIDNELDANERRLVERALLDSQELRELHKELLQLREEFEVLPRHEVSNDFRERVLQRAELAQPTVVPGRQEAGAAGWQVALAAALAIGAAVLVAVGIRDSESDRPEGIAGVNDPQGQDPQGQDGDFDWTKESFVYYRPDTEGQPKYSLVIDVTVTEQGEAAKALEAVLKAAGIPLDPDLQVDDELQSTLLTSRFLNSVEVDDETESDGPRQRVEMTYIVGDGAQVDDVWNRLRARRQDFFPPPTTDLTVTMADREVMHRLNESSRKQFATLENRGKRTIAHRLVFKVSLRSPVRLMGTIPSPSVEATLVPTDQESPGLTLPEFSFSVAPRDDETGGVADPPTEQPAPAGPSIGQLEGSGSTASEVLLIVRYAP